MPPPLVAQPQPENLQSRRVSDKVYMNHTVMYKIINGLVNVSLSVGLIEPSFRSSRGPTVKLQVPQPDTDSHRRSFFPSAIRLELSAGGCLISCIPTIIQIFSEGVDRRLHLLITTRTSDFYPVFKTPKVPSEHFLMQR